MLPYLKAFTQDLSKAQLRALDDVIHRSREGSTIDLNEAQALISKISEGTKPLFEKPEFQTETVDGCKIATALESLRVDLTALMNQVVDTERVISRHEKVYDSLVNKVQQAIFRLDEMILTSNIRQNNPDVTDVKILDFVNQKNEASSDIRARVDPESGTLHAGTETATRYLQRGGQLKPRLSTTIHSAGVNPDEHRAFQPADVLTESDNKVWAELILSDTPLKATYNSQNYEGLLVSLTIDLPQMEPVNELVLSPFGKYSIDLVAVEYLDGGEYEEIPVDVQTLDTNPTAIRFPTTYTKSIRLVLQQRNLVFRELALERGQLKRSNWLNIMLDRVLQDSINDQGTLDRKLTENRLQRAEIALKEQLSKAGDIEPVDRISNSVAKIVDTDNDNLVTIKKYHYSIGLSTLRVNFKRYREVSEFESPRLKAQGSIYEIELGTTEEHMESDDNIVTSAQHYIDIGAGHVLGIVPKNTDRIEGERLKFDANRLSRSRFAVNTAPAVKVTKDGVELDPSSYQINTTAGARASIQILPAAWDPAANYSLSYNIESGQDRIKILDHFNSIRTTKPEVFNSTEEGNRISLRAHPFVLKELTTETKYWTRLDPFDAIWDWRFLSPAGNRVSTDEPFVLRVDGENFGSGPDTIELTSGISSSVTSLTINDGSHNLEGAFPSEGIIQINNERIYYSSYSGSGGSATLVGLIRGYQNTTPASHSSSDSVSWVTRNQYEPVRVLANGTKAINRTNYETGEHPAFSNTEGPPQFVQIGTTLYFDRPINGRIEITYKRLADYIKIISDLYVDHPSREYTPAINQYSLRLKTATL